MDKLEQQYIDVIDGYELSLTDINGEYFEGVECVDYERIAKQFVEITKDVAIKFAEWRNGIMYDKEKNIDGKQIIRKNYPDYYNQLFEEFIKTL